MSRFLAVLLAAGGALASAADYRVQHIRIVNPKTYLQIAQIAAYDTTGTNNVALMKSCTSSGIWQTASNCNKAVDGTYTPRYHPNIFHSKESKDGWMEVDLGGSYVITRLEIWNRIGCCTARLNGAILTLMNANRDVLETITLDGSKHQVHDVCVPVAIGGASISDAEVTTTDSLTVGGMSLSKIPSDLIGSKAYAPPSYVTSGTVRLQCCEETDCTFVISLYKCPGCPGYDGDLRRTLATDDKWVPNSCAAVFNWGRQSHPMVNFRRVLQPGESVEVDIGSKLAYIVVFKARGGDKALCFRRGGDSRGPRPGKGTSAGGGGHQCSRSCAQPRYDPN